MIARADGERKADKIGNVGAAGMERLLEDMSTFIGRPPPSYFSPYF